MLVKNWDSHVDCISVTSASVLLALSTEILYPVSESENSSEILYRESESENSTKILYPVLESKNNSEILYPVSDGV